MSRNVQEAKTSFLDPSRVEISGNFEFPENLPESYSNSPSTSSSELSNFDLLSDLSDAESPPATQRCALNIFKNINAHHNCPFLTEKDLLVLTLMNLQSSMEGILEKLDNLHILAESANLADLEAWNWRREKYSPAPAPGVSAATAHKTFRPTDFPCTYSKGIWLHRTQAFQSGVQCSNL
ncbi:hypothetical protein TNCV_1828521 [Trichonephila clavipes]|nr:hypothetical protein TNCV_1828521 [Trichonephila clavipes]